MKLDAIPTWMFHVPHTLVPKCVLMHQFMRATRPQRTIELGTGNGKGTFMMAAALQENGEGRLETYDLDVVTRRTPNVHELLEVGGTREVVDLNLSPYSYNWLLMEKLREHSAAPGHDVGVYDFCFLDGAHIWSVDALAFLLLDPLMKDGAWVLFDDLGWKTPDADGVWTGRADVPQVDLIVDLLVRPNPRYEVIREDDTWLWARKTPAAADPVAFIRDSKRELDEVYRLRDEDPVAQGVMARAQAYRATNANRIRRRAKMWLRDRGMTNLADQVRWPVGV